MRISKCSARSRSTSTPTRTTPRRCPHTLVLAPGLVIDKVYCGYWFWGRPSVDQLWVDLQDLIRRTKADFDPTTPKARAAWRAAQPTPAKVPAPRARKRQPARVSHA